MLGAVSGSANDDVQWPPKLRTAASSVPAPRAVPASDDPMAQLKAGVELVLEIVSRPMPVTEAGKVERVKAIRQISEEMFDRKEMARSALGPHWAKRSASEQAEFVSLFIDLIANSYISKINLYSGEPIQFKDKQIDGDRATVHTVIVLKKGQATPVSYHTRKRGGRWLIYDVEIEGIRMISNYRSQFNRILSNSSFEQLLTQLRDRKN